MTHDEAGTYWNNNADAWTTLARAGYDVYRDHLNTPAFMAMLPDVRGLAGLDIGCGEGHNTRLLAARGARMTAIDVAAKFIAHAQTTEDATPLGITYRVASAVALPFADEHFDFATGTMSFMDVPETEQVIAEAYRVLKPGGFLQFSIAHPCFSTAHRRNLRDASGRTYAIEVGDYYRNLDGELEVWLFQSAPAELKATLPKFNIPRFTRTLSEWVNMLLATGFMLERMEEPRPSADVVRAYPALQDATVVSYFLHVRGRKH